MTEDHDLPTNVPGDQVAKLEELDVQNPVETATSVTADDVPSGALPLAGGGLLLVSTIRSLLKGQLRAIPKAIAAFGLLRYGLGKRRSSAGADRGADDSTTFDPSADVEDVAGGTEGKETSDAAHAAAERPDSGRESEIDASGEIDASSQLGDEGETGSRIEFIEDEDDGTSEPREKPDTELGDEDPRRNTDDDDDGVAIDVSDSAMADETSEATGPDPEQAQPTQTDSIEPEETPEEDASHMKVEPDEGDESGDETDETDADAASAADDEDKTE